MDQCISSSTVGSQVMITTTAMMIMMMMMMTIDSTEAYTCYDCRYVSTLKERWQNATCTEPFNSTGISKCTGAVCVSTWANFTTEKEYVLYRTCQNSSKPISVADCLKIDPSNNYFVSGNQCCYYKNHVQNPGDSRVYNQTLCFCQGDDCNGQTAYPVQARQANQPSRAPEAQYGNCLMLRLVAALCLLLIVAI